MPRVLKIAALSLAALPQVLGGYLQAYNSCKFTIWCSGAKNGGFFTSVSEVAPGTWYRSDLEATGDVGAVLKCALNPNNREPFQIELNVDNKGMSWLDISAIDGDPFLKYHRRAEIPGVTGIDLSEPMIEQYKANADTLGWVTSEAYVEDSQNLARFPDGVFDAVVMSLGIFTLSDAVAGAREMHRVLKPGGHAILTTWKTRRPQDIMSRVAEIIRPGGSGGKSMDLDPKWLTSEHLASVMTAGGFKAESMQLCETSPNWVHESLSDLLQACNSPMWTARFCKGWSEEEMGRWAEEVTKQLTEEEKLKATLEMVAHICVAQKDH
ncbi:hypothetical protein GQX73_g738 [Xylaria multiplex]|uniref:Methyltransferase type 11 domain-containing protein n=1 Tax=Xylaria multiplex TaxID=323545 RepID=A0A7C8N0B3_9PEZI|nr:hypothetical protein GQX73_g738 [Xylaria multiplex]